MHIARITALFLSAFLLLGSAVHPVSAEDAEMFYEDFSGEGLDYSRWLVAEKNWGGKIEENGEMIDYNGGVIPENVSVRDGRLILTGFGNDYEGEICGINRDGTERENGKRTGAAIATREYFASGSYEISAKIAPEIGACSAMWTFEYEEDYSGDSLKVTNHEIDIEFPGRSSEGADDYSFDKALCTTWIGENGGEYYTNYTDLGMNFADGAFHRYRFDWHTGDAETGEEPRVDFYFDDVLVYTAYDYIPSNAGRLWLGLWFPRYWAGAPDFDTTTFEIDYVKIIPFHESGDMPENESYPDDGWAEIPQIPGDVNLDGIFSVTDVVMMQKWMLCAGEITDWQAGDLWTDGRLDGFDLAIMKREILREY